jgi:uncharacterized protein YceK
MKKLLLALLVISAITGCSTMVNVEKESCQERGVLDGKTIEKCKLSHSVL